VAQRPSDTVLVLATSGKGAQVGLHRRGRPLEVRLLGAGAARGRDLLPTVARLLGDAGLAPQALGGLAVDVGPGSFTGVRVGVTAGKSLAFALGVPVVGVTSLDALAVGAPAAESVLALRDAGRGTVYAALFGPADGAGRRAVLRGPARVVGAELAGWPRADRARGEEAPALVAAHALSVPAEDAAAGAADVLALALPRLAAGERVDPAALVPLYLQASAPERLLAGEAPAPPEAGRSRSTEA
jgi:tRNA threonylcarbamoyladenosine biosynthesis protein TsaB